MRVLVTCVSGYSHFHSMVPLAHAALKRGHEVAFATAQELAPLVAAAGFDLIPSGPGRLRMRAELRRLIGPLSEGAPQTAAHAADPGPLFGELIPRLRWRSLAEGVARYNPDVLLCEALDLAGPLVAKLADVPSFVQSIGPYHPETTSELRAAVEPLYRQQLGRASSVTDIVKPYIDVCPPALQGEAAKQIGRILPARLPSYHGPLAPADQASRDGRPRLLITFGTVSNDILDHYGDVAAQLAADGWLVTVTLGPRGWFDWSSSRRQATDASPSFVNGLRMTAYVPLDVELPRTALLIHHGGSNTIRAAIEHAVPALVIPQSTEQRRNAQWVSDQGLGILLDEANTSPAAIASLSRQLATDLKVSRRLRDAQAAWSAMPSGDELFDEIESQIKSAGRNA